MPLQSPSQERIFESAINSYIETIIDATQKEPEKAIVWLKAATDEPKRVDGAFDLYLKDITHDNSKLFVSMKKLRDVYFEREMLDLEKFGSALNKGQLQQHTKQYIHS